MKILTRYLVKYLYIIDLILEQSNICNIFIGYNMIMRVGGDYNDFNNCSSN